jgi:hypothetical protein
MADPRHRLRPLLHSGIAFKVAGAVDEILAAGDPALVDWALGPAKLERPGADRDAWRFGDACGIEHPSLPRQALLRLVGGGTSPRCAELRAALASIQVEGEDYGPRLDLSSLAGATWIRTLRVHGCELPSRWEWRAEVEPRAVLEFATLRTLTGLEHLIVAAAEGVDLAALADLPRLRRLELVAVDVADLAPLAATRLESLYVAACPALARIDGLPPTLRTLHLEDLPALTAAPALAGLPALAELDVAGVPISPPPARPGLRVRFAAERPPRTGFDPA